MSFLKKKLVKISLIIFLLLAFSYYFFGKLFPEERGIWTEEISNSKQEAPLNFGFEGPSFFSSVSFPGNQDVCFEISLKKNNLKNSSFRLPYLKTIRAGIYPVSGSLSDLFQMQNVEEVPRRIQQKEPVILSNLTGNIARDGKNTFFLGDKEKFLIPDRAILSSYFPGEITIPEKDTSGLDYSDKLVSFPDGLVVSHGEGVFLVSGRGLVLVRSPEVFDALGYDWNKIKALNDFEYILTTSGKIPLIDFNFAHPNGTILNENGKLFFVFEKKLFEISTSQQNQYFSNQPEIKLQKTEGEADCKTTGNKVNCCVKNFNPMSGESDSKIFNGTIRLDTSSLASRENIQQISWNSKILVNKENSMRRIKSLKNYILAQLGLL